MSDRHRPSPVPPVTHYCDWDQNGRDFVRALCGQLIKRRDHQNDPTCPNCQAGLAQREQADV